MQARELIDEARTPGGDRITLTRESSDLVVRVDNVLLMSSGAQYSEMQMAEVVDDHVLARPNARILVGGLGIGYTLRAALDAVGPKATVVVSELLEAVVKWNRGVLGELAGHPLDDPRTELALGDLVAYVRSRPAPFDAMLLDIDCGPDSFTTEGNSRLYSRRGLTLLRELLTPGGVLVVWSGYDCPLFVKSLRDAGFEPQVVRTRARSNNKGPHHVLYLGRPAFGPVRRPPDRRSRRGGRRRRR